MEALYLQHLVSSQLIPSDVELPYGSIWRKSNNCLKRTIFVSMHVVVVCGVMSRKPPCPGINSIASFLEKKAPTAKIVEESSGIEGLSDATSRLVVNGTTLVGSMDRSLDNRTENGAPAVTSGVDGTAIIAQSERGERMLALLTDAFGSDTRGKERRTVKKFVRAYLAEIGGDECDAMQLLMGYVFNLRDVREGKGERDLSFWVLSEISRQLPDLFHVLLRLFVQEFGSFQDLLGLYVSVDGESSDVVSVVRQSCVSVLVDSLIEDSGSLAGKWAPRHQSKKTSRRAKLKNQMAEDIAKALLLRTVKGNHLDENGEFRSSKGMNFALKNYRKKCSELTTKANVVEQKMSSGKWDDIEPGKVPSCATHKYRLAFQNLNKERRERSSSSQRRECARKFEEAVTKCVETGKGIKGSVKGAHGIVAPFVRGEKDDNMLEAMWTNLIHEAREKFGREGGLPSCVSLVDVSCSMNGVPMEVAVALGLVVAETAPEGWGGRVLTFESTPRWHQIKGNTLAERVRNLMSAPWGGSTDFAAAMNMILDHAVKFDVPEESMPEVLFVFSDMQFNTADGSSSKHVRSGAKSRTGFQHATADLRRGFEEAGYKMPCIVFWDLRGECKAKPCETITEGVFQMSGYSAAMLNAFMEGKLREMASRTPTDLMLEVLEGERYKEVHRIVSRFYFNPGC
jgi:hypothetical protein